MADARDGVTCVPPPADCEPGGVRANLSFHGVTAVAIDEPHVFESSREMVASRTIYLWGRGGACVRLPIFGDTKDALLTEAEKKAAAEQAQIDEWADREEALDANPNAETIRGLRAAADFLEKHEIPALHMPTRLDSWIDSPRDLAGKGIGRLTHHKTRHGDYLRAEFSPTVRLDFNIRNTGDDMAPRAVEEVDLESLAVA